MSSWEDALQNNPYGFGAVSLRSRDELERGSDSKDSEVEDGGDPDMSVSQRHFIDSCNNMKIFMAMCRGLSSKDNVRQLADFSDPVHASLPEKRQYD